MLKVLRDNLKFLSWILWVVIFVFIAFVFVDFGGGLQRGGPAQDVAVTVGDRDISRQAFEREYRQLEQRYRQAFGQQWNSQMAQRMQLPVQALEALVDRELLADEAARRGIEASDEDLRRAILEIDGLKDAQGRFVGEEGYRRALRGIGTTPREFEAELRREIAVTRLRELIESGVAVTEAQVESSWRDANENASIRYALFPTARFQAEAAPSQAELESYFNAHTDEFRLPDQRVVDYLLVDQAALRAGVALERAELESDYQARRSEFVTPEQVRVRHVLVRIDDSRSKEQAEARIAEAKAKLARGTSFEKVAAEYSDDPSNKDSGGDLGLFGRGAMVPAFEEAAFGASPGQVVGPVETSFGLHLIELLERQPERVRSFEEAEAEIRARLAGERAKALAETRAKELAARIRTTKPAGEEGWKALADGTTVVFATTPAFGEGEPVPGIGRNPDFAAAAFALAPDAPGVASDPVEVARGWAILRLREEKPARVPTLAEVEPRVRAAAQREKANKLAESRAQTARAAILAGAKLDDVVTPLGLEIKESGEFTRAGSIPGLGAAAAIAEAAFAANPGEVPAPVVIAQGAVLFELVAKSGFDRNRYASERDSTRASLKSEASRKLLEALLRERRTELGVRYDPDLAERLNLAGAGRNG